MYKPMYYTINKPIYKQYIYCLPKFAQTGPALPKLAKTCPNCLVVSHVTLFFQFPLFRAKIALVWRTDGPTDQRTDGRKKPLIEMHGCILKEKQVQPSRPNFLTPNPNVWPRNPAHHHHHHRHHYHHHHHHHHHHHGLSTNQIPLCHVMSATSTSTVRCHPKEAWKHFFS